MLTKIKLFIELRNKSYQQLKKPPCFLNKAAFSVVIAQAIYSLSCCEASYSFNSFS